MVLSRARGALRDAARGTARRAGVWTTEGVADSAAVDVLVAATLTPDVVGSLNDPPAYVKFLRDAWRHLPVSCSDVGELAAPSTLAETRFDTLVETLRSGVPPLPARRAVDLATTFDSLAALREPFERPRYATDAAHHAVIASSQAAKARLLAAMVRFMRARSVVDIGTAYGMSALYLTGELPADGRVVTLEISEPQLGISARVLSGETQITRIAGASQERVGEIGGILPTIDFLCHDGAHSQAAYIADFEAYVSLMPSGAVWFLDDIRWEDPRVCDVADTYAGWQQITRHPRVRRALELDDGSFGVVQLS